MEFGSRFGTEECEVLEESLRARMNAWFQDQ